MVYTIENESLQLQVDTLGAQMLSIRGRDGWEYLWQGDPAYWRNRAPVLFPFVGRLEGAQYQYRGHTYPMGLHGFAASCEFTVQELSGNALVLALEDSPQSRLCYPFAFRLMICFRLVGNTLYVENCVINRDTKPIHFGFGAHPGFRLPLEDGGSFESCYLEFSAPCRPSRIGFTTDSLLPNGQVFPYPLEDDRRIPLRHSLFHEDAIVLKDTVPQISIKSHHSCRGITVAYPQIRYLGLWHTPGTDAPFLCIEPWVSLPGRSGVTEKIDEGDNYIHLDAGRHWQSTWSIQIETG